MELMDIIPNGSSFNEEYQFHNQAITLVFREGDREKTMRANLHYYPLNKEWDLNPIFYEFTDEEKEKLIHMILASGKVDSYN
ncbi:hypothetical protein [Desulfitobacterium sp. AusDCA]|uniref:hypothetical protein n=1 Tax=Desulfitobacterium sp. AusDCA TaxID=3240383 RepID=UPI003DA7A1FF